MSERPILLKLLLRERHWQNYGTFCAEYDKAAARIDADLAGSVPSRAQLHRWLTGSIRSLPYPRQEPAPIRRTGQDSRPPSMPFDCYGPRVWPRLRRLRVSPCLP